MAYGKPPATPITPEQAVAHIRAFVAERAQARVLMAEAFTEVELTEGTLTATWNENAIGKKKSDLLLELNPFENLAVFIGTPLSFDNEEGRQLRQHIQAVSVVGPFGVGTMSARELYERATGLPADQP